MSENPEDPKAKQAAMAANACKATGALVMLASPLVAFNVFGIAELLQVRDGLTEYLLGATMLVMGLVDFFLVPQLLARAAAREQERQKNKP